MSDTVTVGARVSRSAAETLQALARGRGVRPSDVIRKALAKEFEWIAPGLAEELEPHNARATGETGRDEL